MDSAARPSHRHPDLLTGAGEDERRQEAALTAGRPSISLVIVDDMVMVAESFARILTDETDLNAVAVASSAASGLAAVKRLQPDVLLLGQLLPDGLGTDHLAAMLGVCPQLKVLMLTADHSDDLVTRAIGAGAVGVVRKTGRLSSLIDAVRAVARGESVLSSDDLRQLIPRSRSYSTKLGDDLTTREREVLSLLAAGRSTSNVADTLCVVQATARNHIQSIMTKLGAHSRLEAVSIALRENIIEAA